MRSKIGVFSLFARCRALAQAKHHQLMLSLEQLRLPMRLARKGGSVSFALLAELWV